MSSATACTWPDDRLGRDRRDARDRDRVLPRDRGDRRHPVHAAARERLQVGLDARAAARVRAGDREHAGCAGRGRHEVPRYVRHARRRNVGFLPARLGSRNPRQTSGRQGGPATTSASAGVSATPRRSTVPTPVLDLAARAPCRPRTLGQGRPAPCGNRRGGAGRSRPRQASSSSSDAGAARRGPPRHEGLFRPTAAVRVAARGDEADLAARESCGRDHLAHPWPHAPTRRTVLHSRPPARHLSLQHAAPERAFRWGSGRASAAWCTATRARRSPSARPAPSASSRFGPAARRSSPGPGPRQPPAPGPRRTRP